MSVYTSWQGDMSQKLPKYKLESFYVLCMVWPRSRLGWTPTPEQEGWDAQIASLYAN